VLNSTDEKAPPPVIPHAIMLANVIQYDTEESKYTEEMELSDLLSHPHVAAILTTHDKIANKEYPLKSVANSGLGIGAEPGQGVKGFSNPVRVIHLEKNDKPLVSRSCLLIFSLD